MTALCVPQPQDPAAIIPLAARTEILRRLHAAEEEHNVRILLAVESGSRAWGFASPDSDFDARFIYVKPRDAYLSVGLEEQRDVIEYPIVDEMDINGWDVRKALRLFWKSNPAFIEWMQSPIVYMEATGFAAQVRQMLPEVYSRESGIYHYRNMAKTNFREYLKGEQVKLKKYFYVLRPLLAVRWLDRQGTPAPIEFEKLLAMVDDDALLADIHALLARKRGTPEMGMAPPVPSINAFIEAELARLESVTPERSQRGEVLSRLDEVFHLALDQAWA